PHATIDRASGVQYLVYASDFPDSANQRRLWPAVEAGVAAGRYRVVCRYGNVAAYEAVGSR
ncbi:MAG: hypothetical protein JO003_11815, partial [Candidatus Eremiobacteraeota bacterium]|nr:hypothetical protein [Candidatus Eremiobacteraeota bacterium]